MRRDTARVYTDRKLNELTKELERVYSRALDETQAKWNEYAAKHEARANDLYGKWQKYKAAGNTEKAAEAKAAYQKYLRKTAFAGKQYKKTVEDISWRLAHIDKEAWRIVKNYMPDVYKANYNSLSIPKGYSFHLIDTQTVINLTTKDIDLLKTFAWNKRRFNAEILQAILQGESIPKIAKRLLPYVDGNKVAAVRNARTAITSAENRGRLDSMKAADDIGLIYMKQWIATEDSRTRESHREIDGEMVGLDEDFSNGCNYPADPSGEPEEVYNCRCTMDRVLVGIRQADGSVKRVTY